MVPLHHGHETPIMDDVISSFRFSQWPMQPDLLRIALTYKPELTGDNFTFYFVPPK